MAVTLSDLALLVWSGFALGVCVGMVVTLVIMWNADHDRHA